MKIDNLPDIIREFGFNKTMAAIQTLHDSDAITERNARALMRRMRHLYVAQFKGECAAVNNDRLCYLSFDYDDARIARKIRTMRLH